MYENQTQFTENRNVVLSDLFALNVHCFFYVNATILLPLHTQNFSSKAGPFLLKNSSSYDLKLCYI